MYYFGNIITFLFYRYLVLNNLPKLKFLDSSRVTLDERLRSQNYIKEHNEEFCSECDGSIFNPKEFFRKLLKRSSHYIYSPLPTAIRTAGEHNG